MSDDEDFCGWVDNKWKEFTKAIRPLLDRHSVGLHDFAINCDKSTNKQIMRINTIRCVPPSSTLAEAWATPRLESARKWITPQTAQSTAYYSCADGRARSIGDMPSIYRTLSLTDKDEDVKYKIGDGNHRIIVAKEKGIPCILAQTEENYEISESDL